jgi:carbamoyl-phosphate synthase large subunit
MADATYIEPIEWKTVEKIIEKEKPDALLPTMGGQTALNCALDLDRHGVLEKHNVEMIGANKEAIDKAEDRELFRQAMLKIGLDMPKAAIAHTLEEALKAQEQVGFPTIIRPSFTMGGSGGGIAYNKEQFVEICLRGLDLSPTNELLIEESILGWKEFEMEVVRDNKDNCIIICSIENFDPMGVHTGDSITVAPALAVLCQEWLFLTLVLSSLGV